MTTYAERAAANDESRNRAEHHAEEWSVDEIKFLLELWNKEPEADVAEVLGRTIEACRQRFYMARRGARVWVTVKSTTTHEVTHYIGIDDQDEDRWWDPSNYLK